MTDAASRLPAEAPLAMPVQRFGGRRPGPSEVPVRFGDMFARRILLILATLLLAVAASGEVRLALIGDGIDGLDLVLLLLFFPLFGWIAFGFVASAIGFTLLMTHRHPGFVPAPEPRGPLAGRTAVLVPVYNEDVDAVGARIRLMRASLADAGGGGRFAFFVLSDSGADVEAAETAMVDALGPAGDIPVFYRRRPDNIGRKPGNVAEWVRRFGAAYDYMLVLDADSLMSGRAMTAIASILDQRPSIGLLQTVPSIVGATTLFQHWMQFASRLYGPLASAGLVWWSGSESTFWGHNAILRTQAFAESCGLPDLPGKPPLGGAILSHDLVEAARLRRRGWAAHMVMVEGSYEEFPPTMVDHAVRDRRWAQGNLQHLRLLDTAGLHWVSRLQLFIGASAYMTSPAWLLLIVTVLLRAYAPQDAAVGPPSLAVLALTLVLLFGPRLLAVIWTAADRDRRAGFGGMPALLRSMAAEVLMSMLHAPATMITQTADLIGILAGRGSGWSAQNREGLGLPVADAVRHYRLHLAAGGALLLASLPMPIQTLWMLPVIAGLLLAPWLAVLTASRDQGRIWAKAGLFQVPPPTVPLPTLPVSSIATGQPLPLAAGRLPR